jgi:hypothetical protein
MSFFVKVPFRALCLLCLLAFAVTGCVDSRSLTQSGRYRRDAGTYSPSPQTVQRPMRTQFPSGLPSNFQAYKQRYQSVATSPEGAVRMYFDALYSYIAPKGRSEGVKMLRYSLHERQGWERSPAYSTFVSRLNNASWHYVFRSFASGTSPENNYSMSPNNYRLMFASTRQETDYVLVMIHSSGADSPRPLQVKQFDDGLWYVVANHGTYSDVRKPAGRTRAGSHDASLD